MKLGLVSVALALLVFWLESGAAQAQSQGADVFGSPKNLQVLPKDIDSQTLRGYMVGAAQGLGVRCWACHIGEEGQDLSTFNFESDEKPMKLVAREMFRMTLQINETHMPNVAKLLKEAESERVRCVTCHRGETEPSYEQK